MSREAAEAGSTARVRVRWARRRLEGLGRGALDTLPEIGAVVYAINELESALVMYVMAARDRGCSWAQIGAVLGVSRQAARQRYAGALRRREAHSTDWVRESLAGSAQLRVDDQRGVWEGHIVRVNGRTRT